MQKDNFDLTIAKWNGMICILAGGRLFVFATFCFLLGLNALLTLSMQEGGNKGIEFIGEKAKMTNTPKAQYRAKMYILTCKDSAYLNEPGM